MAHHHFRVSLAPVDGFWGCLLAGGSRSGSVPGCQVPALAVWVNAGLLLSVLVVCVSWLISLALLATARGGASFVGP
jgi:hypothetical protein